MLLNTDRLLISAPLEPDVAASQGGAEPWYEMAYVNTVRMLAEQNARVEEIDSPEQFKSAAFARSRGLEEGAYAHLMLRSTEAIRPVAGHYNIAWFGWGFEVLRTDAQPQALVLKDQRRMLSLCDEVWVPSTFSRAIAAENGVEAHVLPAPVFCPEQSWDKAEALRRLAFTESVGLVSFSAGTEPDHTDVIEGRRRSLARQEPVTRALKPRGSVFLTVCDPSDKAQNFANLVEGFLLATQSRSNAVLLVKLLGTSVPGVAEVRRAGLSDQTKSLTLAESIFRQVRPAFGHPHCVSEERVILMSDASIGEDAEALYGLANFYLSASLAEAQNIPLLQAMAHGCVPVSVSTTGMADYIGPDNATVITSKRYPGLVTGLAADAANKTYSVNHADRYQVAQAVRSAIELSPAQYAAKQQLARETVRRGFAPEVIFERLLRRLRLIDPSFSAESLASTAPRGAQRPGRTGRDGLLTTRSEAG
jgi:glycosyltransferase involved in cell wall biosynthesis